MKIDYFCFSVPTLDTTDYEISEQDSENTVWIKTKNQELMEDAKENGMLLTFDRTTKNFYKGFDLIDIKGLTIFPISFMPYEDELLNAISDKGGKSIQTIHERDKIINWPTLIQPTHRTVISTTYKEFLDNHEYYKDVFDSIFFKTAKKSSNHCVLKNYGYFVEDGKTWYYTKPTMWGVSFDDTVFLSEKFEPINDPENDMDCREYRVFVLNHQLLSISRSYVDYPTEVPVEVMEFVLEQIKKASLIKGFPGSYVLDVGEVLIDGKRVIDIIEYNPISSSGLEVCNRLVYDLLNKKSSSKQFQKEKN